jgi:HEAT repeat protein
METVQSFVLALDPILRYVIAGVVGAGIVAWVALFFILRGRFVSMLKKALQEGSAVTPEAGEDKLCRKASLILKLLKHTDQKRAAELMGKTGIASAWVSTLKRSCRRSIFKRVLEYQIDEGLFTCFKYALGKSSYRKRLLSWIEQNPMRLPLISIAHSGNGEDFDRKRAYALLSEHAEEIRDMLGDPNWKGRFFAMKVLMDTDDVTVRHELIGLFADTCPIIRRRMIEEFEPLEEKQKSALFDTILKDPNDRVRASAERRYRLQWGGLPDVDPGRIGTEETLHLIGALRTGNRDDEALATDLVLGENLEVRFHAARYLESSGALSRYCKNLDMGDKKDFDRKKDIMKASASVGVTAFLRDCIEKASRESLLIAGSVLEETGDRELIPGLLKITSEADWTDAYQGAVSAAVKRGNREAKALVRDELLKHLNDRELLVDLIAKVTPLDDGIFIDPLIRILDHRNDITEITSRALLKKDSDMLTERLLRIILDRQETYSERLKIEGLLLLASLKKDYCLSLVFENLPLLPVEFVNELSGILTIYPKTLLKRKIGYYLGQIDGEVRSHIIALIPKTGFKEFLPEVRRALGDADPMVRIAATYALVEMDDTRSFSLAITLLRDPDSEVREQVAFALGRTGRPGIMKEISNIFYDKNEITSVKRSIIMGLAESKTVPATDLLLDFIESDDLFSQEIIGLLKTHSDKNNITLILERMKDSSAGQKDKIAQILQSMSLRAKPALVGLLESEFKSLKTHAGDVLDAIGGTDEEIVKLKHRDPAVRREAARTLSLIGTTKAFRGLIMASRDPDREVRVNVVKALEKLETKEGKQILKMLEEDPDSKIRKYTHWALERLRAKELV